jgi:DNA-binding Lrp family transcriptional regulator
MEEEGIIKNYYAAIDAYKLGYQFYRIYLNFQYVTSDLKKEIIKHFVEYEKISTVSTARGFYDLIIVFWVKEIQKFYRFWEKTLIKYGNYFADQLFSLYINGYGYQKSILLDNKPIKNNKEIETFGINKNYEIDETNYKLLNKISLDARCPLVILAKQLNCSSQNVNYRLKNLIDKGIIQSFRVNLDLDKIGLIRNKINIYLKEHEKRIDIVNFLKKLPNLSYFSTTIGLCDLELELLVKDNDEFIKIIETIDEKFPGAIRNYNYYSDIVDYIETFLPRMTEKDFK